MLVSRKCDCTNVTCNFDPYIKIIHTVTAVQKVGLHQQKVPLRAFDAPPGDMVHSSQNRERLVLALAQLADMAQKDNRTLSARVHAIPVRTVLQPQPQPHLLANCATLVGIQLQIEKIVIGVTKGHTHPRDRPSAFSAPPEQMVLHRQQMTAQTRYIFPSQITVMFIFLIFTLHNTCKPTPY